MVNVQEDTSLLLINAGFKKRKLSELNLPSSFEGLDFDPEIIPLCDKAGTSGILLFEDGSERYAAVYTLKRLKPGKAGNLRPVVCDFCFTQRPGTKVALITFNLNREKTKTVAQYICADLACSMHVRGLTDALVIAKSQVSEDITIDDRIERLKRKTAAIFEHNGAVKL